jgi:hypothetical protein
MNQSEADSGVFVVAQELLVSVLSLWSLKSDGLEDLQLVFFEWCNTFPKKW